MSRTARLLLIFWVNKCLYDMSELLVSTQTRGLDWSKVVVQIEKRVEEISVISLKSSGENSR